MKHAHEVGKSVAGVDDVFNDEHVPIGNGQSHIHQQPNCARVGRLFRFAIAGDGDELDAMFHTEAARQVGKEDERPFEDADEDELICVGVILVDLRGEFFDPAGDVRFGYEYFRHGVTVAPGLLGNVTRMSSGSGNIRTGSGLQIPEDELVEIFQTSGGPGGQHANRSATAVALSWAYATSRALTEAQRRRLEKNLGARGEGGTVRVVAEDSRSQWRNRKLARSRLASLIDDALKPPAPPRRATKPTRSSQRRRIDKKRRVGKKKELRRRPDVAD